MPAANLKITNNAGTTEFMRVTSTGNVGIGTTGPTYQLQLSADSAGKPNGGSWANSSDLRLKRDVRPMEGALAKLIKLRGVNFQWKNPDEHGDMTGVQGGFIAQEVEKVFPGWVKEIEPSGNDVALVAAGEKVKSLTLPFEYDALVVESIKELKAENDALKARVAALEKRFGGTD